MKRTRSTSKATNSTKQANKHVPGEDETEAKAEDVEHQFQAVQAKNSRNQKLSNTLETDGREALNTAESATLSASDLGDSLQAQKNQLNFKSLRDRSKASNEDFKPNAPPKTNKPRAVVDLKMMAEELKQLEDPPSTAWEKQICSNRLPFSFFDSPCEQLAQNLLGKILVRCLENGTVLKGRIVETEAYLGVIDKASHTYQNKVTPRNTPMYMPPGTIYVYMTYGMYHCFNISSQGEGCAVLIRAVEPLEGIEAMATQRASKGTSAAPKKRSRDLKTHELCNGPSKLCIAFQLRKSHSKHSMCSWKGLWIERGDVDEEIEIVKCPRIGIDNYGAEWSNKPLRYYVHGSKSVSKRNKKAELLLGLN